MCLRCVSVCLVRVCQGMHSKYTHSAHVFERFNHMLASKQLACVNASS